MLRWLIRCLIIILALLAALWVAALYRERDVSVPAGTAYFQTPLGRVAGRISGPRGGAPVLIVPGTAGWSGFWRDVASHLAARGYRVIAIDLPPFGYSDHDPARRYDRSSQAARLSAVLAQAAGQRAIVIGHSFGAGSATELALRHPDQVARLVLVDAALGKLDPAGAGGHALLAMPVLTRPLIAASLTNPWAIGPLSRSMLHRREAAAAWRDTLRQPMRRPGTTAAYAAWLPALFAADDGGWSRRSAKLAGIAVPVRLIWGEADTVTPIAQGEALARLMHAPLTRLPDVGHIPHIEDPAHFLPALDAAIEERR
jgi:pimeloyl-ACP methyl ester carboxylesterase